MWLKAYNENADNYINVLSKKKKVSDSHWKSFYANPLCVNPQTDSNM